MSDNGAQVSPELVLEVGGRGRWPTPVRNERHFWIRVRRGLLTVVRAIEEQWGLER
jgi:hypothetical protein